MTLSLPLRINLISLVFATLVASVLTALGGFFLQHQQTENAVNRAKLAADELTVRVNKLLDLELKLADFIGFDEQCAAVIRNDPLLRSAALHDAAHARVFHSPGPRLAWPADVSLGEGQVHAVLDTPEGPLVLRPLLRGQSDTAAYALVAVDGAAVTSSTLRIVAWLVACALALFVLGLLIQQGVFWRTVGLPLAGLVRAADGIQPDNLASLLPLQRACARTDDDIGRLYCAFSRLMQRLLDARAELLAQNERLEATVQERTLQLARVNEDLAQDIERRKQLEDDLRRLASTDALTGLANRSFILPYAMKRLEAARRDGKPLGLMMMDFDGFKAINDTHGHAVGDEVLCEMARRLKQACRSSEVVARMGGDEFLLAFESFADARQVRGLAQRLLAVFEVPVAVGTLRLKVGVSLGAAWYPAHAPDFDGVLAAADAAMYGAKQRGGGLGLPDVLQATAS